MNQDVGETQIARQLVDRYPELSCYISFQGLKKLARRALLRGYSEQMVVFGLDTVIKKNYKRDEYRGNDALDEKRFILDAEFRAVMQGQDETKILWCQGEEKSSRTNQQVQPAPHKLQQKVGGKHETRYRKNHTGDDFFIGRTGKSENYIYH